MIQQCGSGFLRMVKRRIRSTGGGGRPEQLTFFPDRVTAVEHSPNNDQLLLHQDTGGNERAQMYVADGDGSVVKSLWMPLLILPRVFRFVTLLLGGIVKRRQK